jgi:nicotinate-nucleotide pyrophosphorylase (carboxylating)
LRDFHQTVWDDALAEDWRSLLRLAIREDLADAGDLTTKALVPEDAIGRAAVAARQAGVVAGLAAVEMTLKAVEPRLRWVAESKDGQIVQSGARLGLIEGPIRGLLSAERLVLNLLGHLSGIATLTNQYVRAVQGTRARIYDTRKTTPGWRRLEKYAVRCGGGWNHRGGLYEAVLIKDNHLAVGDSQSNVANRYAPAEAVARARQYLRERVAQFPGQETIVEVEVDDLRQLAEVLPSRPDLILLDNMSPDELREAVSCRDAFDPSIELEASGGVNAQTVRFIAESGVERISIGALTHSAPGLDIALDWIA